MDFKTLEPQVRGAFNDSLFEHLNIGELRKMLTIPIPGYKGEKHIQLIPYTSNVVVLDEYSDYLNVTEANAAKQANILGAGCAILYNALIKNARLTHGHSIVTDLLDNDNLKFHFVMNAEPSVADPLALIPG